VAPGACSRFFRGVIVFVSAGAALFVGYYGVLVTVESVRGSGSSVGSAFLFVLGIFCLCFFAVILIVCTMKWTSANTNH
jgi:hypothetical protein